MAKLLFPLRNVPDEEAQKVRDLLDEKQFDWYETSAGNWGISLPALWLKDDSHWEEARTCIDEFQNQLSEDARREYQELRHRGEAPTIIRLFLQNPLLYLLALAGIGLIVYFSIAPFFDLAKP